jgi:hypothetical protein
MNEWVLIIAMLSPAGEFLEKRTVELKSRQECEAVRVQLHQMETPMGIKYRGVCVTKDHWTGRKMMKDMPLD